MRLIDADVLYAILKQRDKQLTGLFGDLGGAASGAAKLVLVQPTVDAVPVVRCKDCKHRSTEDNVWVCPFGLPGGPEFFCGYGVDGKDGDHEKAD